MELIAGIIFIAVVWALCKAPEWTHDNRVCPPGKKIDWDKANYDLTTKGKQEYYRRYNSGYYDIDKE